MTSLNKYKNQIPYYTFEGPPGGIYGCGAEGSWALIYNIFKRLFLIATDPSLESLNKPKWLPSLTNTPCNTSTMCRKTCQHVLTDKNKVKFPL